MIVETEIKTLVDALRNGLPLEPDRADYYHHLLAGQYAFMCSQMAALEIIKNEEELKLRKDVSSDRQATRLFLNTESGRAWVICRMELKKLEKLLSTTKQARDREKRNWSNANN